MRLPLRMRLVLVLVLLGCRRRRGCACRRAPRRSPRIRGGRQDRRRRGPASHRRRAGAAGRARHCATARGRCAAGGSGARADGRAGARLRAQVDPVVRAPCGPVSLLRRRRRPARRWRGAAARVRGRCQRNLRHRGRRMAAGRGRCAGRSSREWMGGAQLGRPTGGTRTPGEPERAAGYECRHHLWVTRGWSIGREGPIGVTA